MVKGKIRVIKHIIESISKFGLFISGIMIVILAIAVTNSTIMRYFFRKPEPYSYEISLILMVACVLFAIPEVQRRDRNIKATFVIDYFNYTIQVALKKIVAPIFGISYVAIIIWQSWNAGLYSLKVHELSLSVLRWPLYPIKLIIPVGYLLLCIVLINQLWDGIIAMGEMINKRGNKKELLANKK